VLTLAAPHATPPRPRLLTRATAFVLAWGTPVAIGILLGLAL
jgi:hypothetical protein